MRNKRHVRCAVSTIRLGMCIPSLHTTYSSAVSTIVAWRLGLRMATAYPGVAIDADSVRSAELMHRNELEIGWAIIGLGRSGTTSLAAWLEPWCIAKLKNWCVNVCHGS